ncbi:DUF1028 domain-containing protein [Rhodococcus globerulus]|uniref:DUF1028 domain-containing protein n=1 Tax=Rhodococcus globerulus TaxID=33008 RepID=A0ABU4C2C7_RHOGO|nr:DUF1028 domain-containing protein [Rhodococcus globerulus]MDV6270650.1 DUF1028 domain-containing protein [Rhodococcus globerulus]
MTYSIVARDPDTGDLGVAAQSHFFGVGRLVGWLNPGVGAVATQAFVNIDFGPEALMHLTKGADADETLTTIIARDALSDYRQLALVDALGTAAAHTGTMCVPGAGHALGSAVAAAGNMLSDSMIPDLMVDAYHNSTGDLADRLLAALVAAEDAGGDARGSQSSCLRIVSGSPSPTPWQETHFDIRVDDHADPVGELARLLPLHRAFDAVGSVMFTPRIMMGPFENVGDTQLDDAVQALVEADKALGENSEARFWHAVLLARADRPEEAKRGFAAVFDRAPHLRAYLRNIALVGFLDDPEQYL